MQLKYIKTHPNAKAPQRTTPGAACFDLSVATVENYAEIGVTVTHGAPITVDTGLAFQIPPGHVGLVFSRSGHGFNHDVRLANCVGVIDSDYRGSVKVKLTCDDPDYSETRLPLRINPGDRVAQLMVLKLPDVVLLECDELSQTERGAGGFGSTGSK